MGLWEDGSVGDLDGFRIGTILSSFQMSRMVFRCMDRLKMSVRALRATGPSSFRCLYEMPSWANRGGEFCLIYCLFRHVGGERRSGIVLGALHALDFYLFSCRWGCVVVWR